MAEGGSALKNITLGCLGCFTFLVLLIVTGGIFLVGGIVAAFSDAVGSTDKEKPSKYDPASLKEEYVMGRKMGSGRQPKIAVIRIRGVMVSDARDSFGNICDSRAVCLRIRRAKTDPSVKAVILELDTPGGEVAAADEIYHELMLFRKECKKPLVAMMNSLAASGGYYVASACKPIVARRSTLTGSIGVIISTMNYSGLFTKLGLENEVYASGKMKDMLNGGRKRTPEEVRIVRSLVECSYADFVRIVSASRNIPEKVIRSGPVGDGRIFSGKQALELGLVDTLGYFRDAVTLAAGNAKIKNYTVITYEDPFDFNRMMSMLFSRVMPLQISVQANPSQFMLKPGVLYYLPAAL